MCKRRIKKIARRFFKENQGNLKHRQESFMARLAIKGFRVLVYEFVIHV